MSVRLEMLQVARLAPRMLADSTDCVRTFTASQQNADGGFKDRSGNSDLYYTVFGSACLAALEMPMALEKMLRFLEDFGDGDGLDLVHLCGLARCWASVLTPRDTTPSEIEWAAHGMPVARRRGLAAAIEKFRSSDGGYNALPRAHYGTAYGGFLALAAYQDLGLAMPDAMRMVAALKILETGDGAWANERRMQSGSTNATAAAVTLLRHLNMPIAAGTDAWLLARAHPQGGFVASPEVPLPDLLSTATALHALRGLETPLGFIQEQCLDFIDSLWTNEGSFHAHWQEDLLDIEYTFYGLMALGHLSLKG